MTIKPHFNPFGRPEATPLPSGSTSHGHEFDNLDTAVGAILTDALRTKDRTAA